jgi:hypothetical protein
MLSRIGISFCRQILEFLLLLVLIERNCPISNIGIPRLAVLVLRKTNCRKQLEYLLLIQASYKTSS